MRHGELSPSGGEHSSSRIRSATFHPRTPPPGTELAWFNQGLKRVSFSTVPGSEEQRGFHAKVHQRYEDHEEDCSEGTEETHFGFLSVSAFRLWPPVPNAAPASRRRYCVGRAELWQPLIRTGSSSGRIELVANLDDFDGSG